MERNFSKALSKAMADAGCTGRQLASELNVMEWTVSRWRNGHNRPDRSVVQKIERILGVRDERLLRSWQLETTGTELAPWQKRKPELERSSHTISYASTHIIPGYLQSPEYTRLVLTNSYFLGSQRDRDEEVTFRSGRYEQLRSVGDPWVIGIFPESSLTCLPEDIRVEQASRLLSLTRNARVEIQLIGPDDLIPLPAILHLYHLRSGVIIGASEHNRGVTLHDDPEGAKRLDALFMYLSRLAMSKGESRNRLKGML